MTCSFATMSQFVAGAQPLYYNFTIVFSFLRRCRIFVDTHFVVDTSEGQTKVEELV